MLILSVMYQLFLENNSTFCTFGFIIIHRITQTVRKRKQPCKEEVIWNKFQINFITNWKSLICPIKIYLQKIVEQIFFFFMQKFFLWFFLSVKNNWVFNHNLILILNYCRTSLTTFQCMYCYWFLARKPLQFIWYHFIVSFYNIQLYIISELQLVFSWFYLKSGLTFTYLLTFILNYIYFNLY